MNKLKLTRILINYLELFDVYHCKSSWPSFMYTTIPLNPFAFHRVSTQSEETDNDDIENEIEPLRLIEDERLDADKDLAESAGAKTLTKKDIAGFIIILNKIARKNLSGWQPIPGWSVLVKLKGEHFAILSRVLYYSYPPDVIAGELEIISEWSKENALLLKIDIDKAIKYALTQKEKRVIYRLILGKSPSEIAKDLHSTKEDVRLIIKKSIGKMSKYLAERGYK